MIDTMRSGLARWAWIPVTAVTSAVVAVAYGAPRLGYDALFALTWGRQLYRFEAPGLEVAGAPTPHPLANLVGALVAPLGTDASATVMVGLACVALAAAGYSAWLIGSRLFGMLCGPLFALVVVTRPGLVVALLYASTDLWFLALVLLAGALIAARPLESTGPLVALALAGLLRPEAWALAIAYVVFLALRRVPAHRLLYAGALTLAAPVIWLTLDWIWAGDPWHSLRATRELAVALERPRGPGAAVDLGAEYLTGLLGAPVLWAGLAGCIVALALVPERAVLPTVVLVIGVAGFATLAVAGLPLIERYVVLPAVALALFAAAAALGWRVLERGRTRRIWMGGGVAALVLGAFLLPGQVRELGDLRALAAEQRDRQLALRTIASHLRAAPARCLVEVPSFQDGQVLVLFGRLEPGQIVPADRTAREPGLRVLERSARPLAAGKPRVDAGELTLVTGTRSPGC